MKIIKNPLILASAVLAMAPLALQAEPLAVGAEAPDIEAVDQNAEKVDLGEVFKEGATLVYFYPKADTPGCTKQACNVRDNITQLKDTGIRVIGVSTDTPEEQKAFAEKYDLNFTLLADKDGKVSDAFGVRGDSGRAGRQSFLVKEGKVVWHDPKATPTSQAADAIEAYKAL